MCPAPTPLEYLEYDEEVEEQQEDDEDNLFGSDPEQESGDPIAVPGSTAGPSTGSLERYNPARPLPSGAQGLITSSTRGGPPSSSSYKGKEKARPVDPRDRLEQLRFMRTPKNVRGPDSRGADSLKAITMIIIRQNAPRIWDIGDLEYRVVADFVNELPMDQLTEVEANSPHIRKDTDWLWEYFLLTDHPLFYSQCREKHGQTRSSGWRRMYKKALEEAENRKANAAERMQQRYKELEEQKQARKTIFVDKLTVPTKGKAARGRNGGMTIVRAGHQMPTSSASSSTPSHGKGIFGKARAEAQRAQVAKTHASGRFDPRVANRLAQPVRPVSQSPKPFENPWTVRPPPLKTVHGPRIPASKGIRQSDRGPRATSPLPAPLPGARPAVPDRAALPVKMLQPEPAAPVTTERYRHEKGKLAPIMKPRVKNFVPPSAPTAALSLGVKRTASPSIPPSNRSQSAASRPLTPAEEAARINSVLFVKKKPRLSKPA